MMNNKRFKAGNKIPSEVIIEGILLETMKMNECKYSDISAIIEALRYNNRLKQNQEKELNDFFLLKVNDFFEEQQETTISNYDFDFYIRKLCDSKMIPNYEIIKLLYQGLCFKKLEEGQAREILSDYGLISIHNKLIKDFEKTLK